MINIIELKNYSSKLSVLYVEDNEILRESFTSYLEKFFKLVVTKQNGEEGLKEFNSNSYDLIITDINMPKMDGIEMSKQIKLIDPSQHIIIVSAYRELNNIIETIKIGIDGYILKPVDFKQVNDILYKSSLQIYNEYKNQEYQTNLQYLVDKKTKEAIDNYYRDPLTGLHNQIYFNQQVNKNKVKSLVLLNISNFSIVNNNFGFLFGDEILKLVTKILKKFQNNEFKLLRINADEFVFFSDILSLENSKNLAKSIKSHFESNKVSYDSVNLEIRFRFVIDAHKTRDLLQSTSLALQELKNTKDSSIKVYKEDSVYENRQKNNLFWLQRIKDEISSQNIKVFYQPMKDIKTDQIYKYEALARIVNKDKRVFNPGDFLEAVEISGNMYEFTKKIINLAFMNISKTQNSISINITFEDLKEDKFVEYVLQQCQIHNIDHKRVVFEVLENISSINEDNILERLRILKEHNFKIAIDDFGAEHSNFARLLFLNVDFIKIDAVFIKNIDTEQTAKEIVKSIVDFAHKSNIEVIAEYVHNKSVYDTVKEIGVDFAQGYYISEPKPQTKDIYEF